MVLEVPLARESVAGNSALTTFVLAKEGLVTMAMEAMCLTFMSEKASSGREAGSLTSLSLATIRLEVRVNKLATLKLASGVVIARLYKIYSLIVALELLGLVVAAALALPGAVVQSILAGCGVLVQHVAPSRLPISTRRENGSHAQAVA